MPISVSFAGALACHRVGARQPTKMPSHEFHLSDTGAPAFLVNQHLTGASSNASPPAFVVSARRIDITHKWEHTKHTLVGCQSSRRKKMGAKEGGLCQAGLV